MSRCFVYTLTLDGARFGSVPIRSRTASSRRQASTHVDRSMVESHTARGGEKDMVESSVSGLDDGSELYIRDEVGSASRQS